MKSPTLRPSFGHFLPKWAWMTNWDGHKGATRLALIRLLTSAQIGRTQFTQSQRAFFTVSKILGCLSMLALRSGLPIWRPRLCGALVLLVGVIGLSCDFLQVAQPRFFDIHLLFGTLVSLTVSTLLLQQRQILAKDADRFYAYTRGVTRWVYLLLYALAGFRLSLNLLDAATRSPGIAAAHPIASAQPLGDFKLYVLYTVIPFWCIRYWMLHNTSAS